MSKDSTKLENIFSNTDLIFKILYLFLTLASFCSYTARGYIVSGLTYIVIVLGGLLGLFRLFHFKRFYANYYSLFLFLFLVSYAISSLVTARFGLKENLQAMTWMGLLFLVVAAPDRDRTDKQHRKDFYLISNIFIFINFILMLISMYYLFTRKAVFLHIPTVSGQDFITSLGYHWGRLWGTYTDPNYGAVLQVVAITFACHFAVKTSLKWLKTYYILTVIPCTLYLLFSGSRTAIIIAIVVATVFILVKNFYRLNWIKVLAILFAGVILAGVSVKVPVPSYDIVSHKVQTFFAPEKPIVAPPIVDARKQEIASDVSNRRFDLWKSGIEVFQSKPVTGVSFRNIVPYVEDKLPNTYLVNNDLGNFESSHNLLFDLLMSQGILGFAIFFFYLLFLLIKFIRLLIQKKPMEGILPAVLAGLLCSSFFIPDIVYVNSPGSFFFWFLMGLFVYSLDNPKFLPDTRKQKAEIAEKSSAKA